MGTQLAKTPASYSTTYGGTNSNASPNTSSSPGYPGPGSGRQPTSTPVLDLLEQHGYVRRLPDPARTAPGRPSAPCYQALRVCRLRRSRAHSPGQDPLASTRCADGYGLRASWSATQYSVGSATCSSTVLQHRVLSVWSLVLCCIALIWSRRGSGRTPSPRGTRVLGMVVSGHYRQGERGLACTR
jgi:hypothetical protein